MEIKTINRIVRRIARENGFVIGREIYRGTYYTKENLRNIILSGTYNGKPAILKYYNDPRITNEPNSLSSFLENNKSKILTAPKIYKKKVLSPNEGWFVAEEISKEFKHFTTPINEEERKEFLKIYLEYRKNFPKKATRKLLHVEKLSPDNFHIFRMSRWLELAQKKEAERMIYKKSLLLDNVFFAVYENAIESIRKEFKNRKMVWCHGHFKPHEVFSDKNKDKYYLIDFAHSAMFPEGYELAFIIWSDYLMSSDKWHMPYGKWKKEVDRWIGDLEEVAKILNIRKPKNLLKVSLIERAIGTVLADIVSSDRDDKEKKRGLKLMIQLIKDLL